MTASQELKDLNCDPIALSAALALGQDISAPHPHLLNIKKKWEIILENIVSKKITAAQLNDFWECVEDALTDSPVPLEIRSKHIMNLVKYVAPQLSSVSQELKSDDLAEVFKSLSSRLPE